MKQLRTVFLLILIHCFSQTLFSQQVITYSGCWGNAGFNLVRQEATGVEVIFSVPQLTLGDITIEGIPMKTIEISGVFLPNDEGAPNLPGTGRYVAIPQGSSASVEILEMRTEVIHNIDIAPAPRIPKETEDGLEYHRNMDIYNQDALYPVQPVLLSEPMKLRGVDAVMLGFTPFRYNPVTKDLIVYKDIKVRINYSGNNGHYGEDRLRSRWYDPLLEDMLLNPAVLPKIDYNRSKINTDDVGFEYLIIVPNDAYFSQWADTIKQFRTRQGIITGIKTLAEIGGNTAADIENYINTAFNTWSIPPVAILLIGDYGSNTNNTIDAPIWNGYCVSDNIYGDVDGTNSMPEIVMARMTAQNEDQLKVMVKKFINYERNPPTSPSFYAHPITALGWQTERWFQLCSEVIGGFWQNGLGKTPVRVNAVYQGDPSVDPWSTASNTTAVVNYFGPSGLGYIPATPQGLGGWTGGTAAMVNSAINEGSFMLQHRDHGMETGWGEPSYGNTDIDGLHNTDLSFIMSVNCLTGKYNYSSEVFAEKFHRYTWNGLPAGALGLLAASEVSYSFVNDAFIWGVYDNMWPEFMPLYGSTPPERGILPAFGNAAGKYFLQQSSWPYNSQDKEVTYNLFHHHGDAFLSVYSEVPQSLTVVHNPIIYTSVTSFDVTANPGSLICLSLNGEILGTATGTGSPVSVTIPGTQLPPDVILVTVTLQNYYRYEGYVTVIPPVGPYVIKDAFLVNDIAGNGNGHADFGENILLTVTMKNVGVVLAGNVQVTLQTSDPSISITDDNENFGDIPSGGNSTMNDAFAFSVSDQAEDGHLVTFILTATDGTNNWSSSFNLALQAPRLTVGSILVSDVTGNNNNRLDPGETVSLSIITNNAGHSDALNTIGVLVSQDTSVTISQDTVYLNTINNGAFQVAIYSIQVSPFAIPGSNIMFHYSAASGNYQTFKYFVQSIGLMAEDWECNSFTHYGWVNSSNAPWTIVSTGPYEGQRCARSGVIGNNASSLLVITMDVVANDSITFYKKVSSEAGYDFLQFMIDNDLKGEWSGTTSSWTREAYPVTAGTHTFTWKYVKDAGATGGQDAAWIDYIVFPPYGAMPLLANATATPSTICLGNSAQLNVTPAGGTLPYTFLWSPATLLSDPTLQNPVASPTISTIYHVSVTDLNNTVTVATVLVNVNQAPVSPNTPTTVNTTICQGTTSTMVSTSAVPNTLTYVWALSPSDAGSTNGSGTSGWLNWNSAFTGLASVTVKAGNGCGQSLASQPLEINLLPAPEATLAPLSNVCINWPPFALSGGLPAGGTYTGTGVNAGIFNPSVAGSGNKTITYTFTAPNGCSDHTSQILYVDPCNGLQDPSVTSGIRLFPNPCQGSFTVSLSEPNTEPVHFTLSNAIGKKIFDQVMNATGTSPTFFIDLSNQADGMYFFTIETSQKTVNQKVIVQRK
ncbi:MAG: C25 family cysteine peptidase [Bacteroidetes bacterium]|nr:C25 family cysteine peptidase [Bacteroidota bacterium]